MVCKCDDHSMLPSDLWVMKKYGVKDSWTKLTTFDFREIRCGGFVGHLAKVLVHSTRGDLWLYDLERHGVESIIIEIHDQLRDCRNLTACGDSLVDTLVSLLLISGD